MEPTDQSVPHASNPWGALISIFLILAIVVAGAYYAFTDRVAPPPASSVETSY